MREVSRLLRARASQSFVPPCRPGAVTSSPYLAVGITNSAPFGVLSGQRCMIDFCLV